MKRIVFILIVSIFLCHGLIAEAAKGGQKGPSERAYEQANDNAAFKRDENWAPGKPKDKHKKKHHQETDDDDDSEHKDKKKKKDKHQAHDDDDQGHHGDGQAEHPEHDGDHDPDDHDDLVNAELFNEAK